MATKRIHADLKASLLRSGIQNRDSQVSYFVARAMKREVLALESQSKKSFTCVLVMDVEAPTKEKAAEKFVEEIEGGWISPEDVQIE